MLQIRRWLSLLVRIPLIICKAMYTRYVVDSKNIYICISIDSDLPADKYLANKAIYHTMQFFKRSGILNKVTWFINDGGGIGPPNPVNRFLLATNMFCWTQDHPDELKKLIDEGCDIELHSHYLEGYWNEHGKKPGYRLIIEYIKKEKESLESFIKNYTGREYSFIGFRAGNYITSTDLYRALRDLDFKFDSSKVPGLKDSFGEKHSFCDYSELSFAQNWHYLDEGLLELPLYYLDTKGIEIGQKCAKSPVVLTFNCGHPDDFIDKRGEPFRLYGLYFMLKLLKFCYPKASWVAMRDILDIEKIKRD